MTAPAALFDLDGTLIESGPGIAASVRRAMAELGHPLDPDADLSWVVGPPLADVFLRLLLPLGRDDRVDEAVALYRRDYDNRGAFEAPLYPGIGAALAAFRAAGWTLFVATSKPQALARRILAHLGHDAAFRAIYGALADGTRAHKPELIRFVLLEEGLDARASVMIGDRSFDVSGAQANGVRAIGALWGYGHAAELEHAGADAIAGNPAELLDRAAELVRAAVPLAADPPSRR